jgi:hypothetical protein
MVLSMTYIHRIKPKDYIMLLFINHFTIHNTSIYRRIEINKNSQFYKREITDNVNIIYFLLI